MSGVQPAVLEFRGSTIFAPVLILYSSNLEQIRQHLQEKITRAPGFFENSPVLFDLSELDQDGRSAVNIEALIVLLRELNLFPIGIRGGDAAQENQAMAMAVPVDSGHSRTDISMANTDNKNDIVPITQPAATQTTHTPAMLITQPVRSGQRIYAASDLVILAQVSAGAEIMAEGNIHVYGTLRGRALAGVLGDASARLFCMDLQAELVSIAGIYKTSEDFKEIAEKNPIQIYLHEQALIIEELK